MLLMRLLTLLQFSLSIDPSPLSGERASAKRTVLMDVIPMAADVVRMTEFSSEIIDEDSVDVAGMYFQYLVNIKLHFLPWFGIMYCSLILLCSNAYPDQEYT